MTQQWVMNPWTNTSVSNAADVNFFFFFFIKTGVSTETLLVINWLTKVMNCAKSWAIVSVEFIAFPLLNTSHACLLRSYSRASLAADWLVFSSVNMHLEGVP